MKELRVELGERSYPIYIGANLLAANLVEKHLAGSEWMVVTNATVAPLYLDALLKALPSSSAPPSVIELQDGEQFKNWATLNTIFDQLLQQKHSRKTTLLALGGGVVGDITGFAAACYQRGIAFIQVPTTLLAQVDSSVGGKTAVNHPLGKNMVGAFHQPQAVIADTAVLRSLPAREFSAGLAEVLKYGLIADADFFVWLEANVESIRQFDEAALSFAIERSCAIKADIVAKDETEQGVRAILNLGHTFGHAIETTMQYQGILHGEAVGIGMLLAAKMSMLDGALSDLDVARVENILQVCDLPTAPAVEIAAADIKAAMLLDKKVVAGSLRLVLLDSIGEARVSAGFSESALDETLSTLFS